MTLSSRERFVGRSSSSVYESDDEGRTNVCDKPCSFSRSSRLPRTCAMAAFTLRANQATLSLHLFFSLLGAPSQLSFPVHSVGIGV